MKSLNPYLCFNGECQQALEFYCHVFNGKITMRQTFGQAPKAVKGVNPSHIMHAEFKAEHIFFMASDSLGQAHEPQGVVILNVGFSDANEQSLCFEKLRENGTVLQELTDTFWGARLAKVQDQFGIQWTLNCHP